MGVISELVAAFCRKPIFGYTFVAFASLGDRGPRLPRVGPPHVRRRPVGLRGAGLLVLSFLVAIPSAVKVFNWTATMYKGSISWETPMLYAHRLHRPVHDRRADGPVPRGARPRRPRARHLLHRRALPLHHGRRHDHGYLGGLHYWWPKITRPHVQRAARRRSSAAIIFVGFNLTFFPQFVARLPRHAAALPRVSAGVPGAERAVVGGRVDPRRRLPDADGLPDLVAALRASVAGSNPWGAVGLEWTTTSPPPTENFAETPVVTWDAYDYPTRVEGHVA